LIAARPKALRLFGAATVIGATVGVIASVIAEISGNQLTQRVGRPEEHANYGEIFPFAAVAFLALLIVFWLFARGVPLNRNRPLWLKVFGAVLIVAAVGITYFAVLTGYSGSRATWSEIINADYFVEAPSRTSL
jgi:protein-S-isoprenylcysteine O-methyltransferase Ste14